MIVDDQWLRLGSSNLSNRSMGMDTECDAVIEARGVEAVSQAIRAFRDGLIAEHTGDSVDDVVTAIERSRSLNAAIGALGSPERALRPVPEAPGFSDALLNTVALADPERPVSVDALVEQFAPDVEVHRAKPLWKKAAWAVLALLGLALVWRYTPLADLLTAEQVSGWARAMSAYWWAPVILVAVYTPASLIMFPRPLLTLSAVVAFGAWVGFFYAVAGILLSATVHYVAGRMLDRDTVRRLAGEKLNRMTHALRERGLLAITALRLVPVAPFAVEGFVAGAVRIKLWHFLVGTLIGMLPGTLAATVFADQLQTALSGDHQINWRLVAGVAVLFVLAIWAVRRWFNRQQMTAPAPATSSHVLPLGRSGPAEPSTPAREPQRRFTAMDAKR
jgi:uncharacterized membrane protein YdjX (TVP38/TMEM64 family)